MQFKSVSTWLKSSSTRFTAKSLFSASGRVALLAAVLGASNTWANVVVTAVEPYQKRTDKLYFPDDTLAVSGTVTDQEDGFDPSTGIFYFDVKSDNTFSLTSGQELAVTVYARSNDSGNAWLRVPIRSATVLNNLDSTAAPSPCVEGSNCSGEDPSNTGNLYKGIYSSQGTLRIGMTGGDICGENRNSSNAAEEAKGCDGTAVDPLYAGGVPTEFSLTFELLVAVDAVDGSNSNSVAAGFLPLSTASEREEVDVVFVQEAPQDPSGGVGVDCPADYGDGALSNLFTPGDTQVFIQALGWYNAARDESSLNFSHTNLGTSVPVDRVVVVADTGSPTPTLDSSIDQRFGLFELTGDNVIEGFANDTAYTFRWGAVNAAGIATFNQTDCASLAASEIVGFLGDSNCFIATAAHGSKDDQMVSLLRRFRDERLLKFFLGQKFVRFYYQISPRYALWLNQNPRYKPWIRAVLLPVELLAWLTFRLEILWFLISGLMGIVFSIWSYRRFKRTSYLEVPQ